jgi:hypothetical protein
MNKKGVLIMISRSKETPKLIRIIPDSSQSSSLRDPETLDSTMDVDVKTALDNYQSAINRYNNTDLSDPRVENVYFLERQVSYISLQLALAKARIRNGMDPSLDYTSFESLLKFVGQSK